MARKEITTPLDLNNLENHNGNYDELYGLIDETDVRISENMWEEIKDANTIKMLEPVQTASDLPAEAPDKSLITVIDEQRVYAYFQDEWQPFNEIDLDPFEPFKSELQTMIDDHEATAQQLLADMQTEHDNAVTEITGLTSDFNTDYQAKMDAFASDYQTKSDQLLADYNSYSSQIDTNTTNSLSDIDTNTTGSLNDIDTAKNSALTELENFQNTDTSNWQKFKLTKDDGGAKDLSDVDFADTAQLDTLEAGLYYSTTGVNIPNGASSFNAFITVTERTGGGIKHIEYRPYNSNQVFIKRFYETWGEWAPVNGSSIDLYNGNVSGVGSVFTLNDDPAKYTYLMVYGTNGDGEYVYPAAVYSNGTFYVKDMSIFAGADGAMMYEIECHQGATPTEYTVFNSLFYRIHTDESAESATASITKIVGVK